MSPTCLSALAICLLVAMPADAAPKQGGSAWHAAPPLPRDWSELAGPVADDQLISLRLSLRQQNIDQLHRAALSVSDPKSPFYGQYLTNDRVDQLTAPDPSDVKVVQDWLAQAEVQSRRPGNREEISATMTVRAAGALLKCGFHRVANRHTGQEVVQAKDYWLPADVESAVAAVYGLHGLPLPRYNKTRKGAEPAKVTPTVIESTYSVSGVKASGSTKNRQAVAEFQGQTMRPSDLVTFFSRFVPSAPASAHNVSKFVGKQPTGTGGVEAMLDLDYIMGVAPGLLTEFWYWGGNDFCGDLKDWTSQIITTGKDGPLVHSVSYGWQGSLQEIGCAASKVKDVDTNFAKVAAMGITIMFASGDSGSGYTPAGLADRKNRGKLYPSWPASSPWITAVGSTRFQGEKIGQPEMATDQFGSGGGFSTMFDAFKDQASAVKTYLSTATGLPPSKLFPAGGRATPDVSALGEGFQVIANGELEDVGGTSASSPTFAGLVSLLNEARLKAGKPPMGYLNPWLYQNPDAFTDITVGTDKIGRGGEKLKYGYDCAKGWDPVTGLGTPIFSKMLAAAMNNTLTAIVV